MCPRNNLKDAREHTFNHSTSIYSLVPPELESSMSEFHLEIDSEFIVIRRRYVRNSIPAGHLNALFFCQALGAFLCPGRLSLGRCGIPTPSSTTVQR